MMILNAYAILDLFVTGLRALLAVALVVGGIAAWRSRLRVSDADARAAWEGRSYLLSLVGITLLALSVAAWPLFYMLLNSYIPHWQGVMCIHGVTRIGAGSLGTSRHLPALVATLEVLRPAVIFLAGGWLVLYLANRASPGAPLARRLMVIGAVMGAVALADASLEAAYLAIPKVEQHLSSGCCSAAGAVVDQSSAVDRFQASDIAVATAAFVPLLVVLAGLAVCIRNPALSWSRWMLGGLAACAGASLLTMSVFVPRVAAPRLLRLPQHHCVYCMLGQVPESAVAILLLISGGFLVGWAVITAAADAALPSAGSLRERLLRWAFWAYLGFAVMFTLELALA